MLHDIHHVISCLNAAMPQFKDFLGILFGTILGSGLGFAAAYVTMGVLKAKYSQEEK